MLNNTSQKRTSREFGKTNQQPVQVVIRVRPSDLVHCLETTDTSVYITNPRNATEKIQYTFNKVFGSTCNQVMYTDEVDIFEYVEPMLHEALNGKNLTIFAYGQTGSGKTHTINGTDGEDGQGLIPRIIKWFLDIGSSSLKASYFEIYNEKIYDLLDPSERKLNSYLDLRETDKKEIIVSGVTLVNLDTMEKFKKTHETALKQRSTGATNLNQESSRSHFILQLTVKTVCGDKEYVSKIHLIDLAGSEDNKRTGNSGARMNESCSINKSLFVLGQVVESLNKNLARVPYRDSKVTRLLQDSLGGKALGIMIACCSPTQENFLDTYNTLNFATKSSLIKNVVAVNEVVKSVPEEGNSRKTSLQEWKARKKIDLGPPSKKARTSSEGNRTLQSRTSETGSETFAVTSREDFEREVNNRVEEKVAEKLKELTNNLVKSKQFQKAVSDRFALVEHRLDKKLEQVSKNTNDGKENRLDGNDSKDLDALKETTRKHMLELLNNGNLKNMYF